MRRDFKDSKGQVLTEGDDILVKTSFYGSFTTKLVFEQGCLGYREENCDCVEPPKSWTEKKHTHSITNSNWFGFGFKAVVGGYSKLTGKDVTIFKV
jgi:hypothetical protein